MSARRYVVNPIVAFIVATGTIFLAKPPELTAAVSITLAISQYQTSGATASDEFVEIHNVSGSTLNLNDYRLVYRTADSTLDIELATFGSIMLPAGGYYLAANDGYDETAVTKNVGLLYSLAAAGGGIAIRGPGDTIVDMVGYGSANNGFIEGTKVSSLAANNGWSRKNNGCTDSDNNANDFALTTPSSPHNASSPVSLCVPLDSAPSILNTFPGSGSENVMPDVTLQIVFSEPVTVDQANLFDFYCDDIEQFATISSSETTYMLDPTQDLPYGAACQVIIYAAAITDQDGVVYDQMTMDFILNFATLPDPSPAVTGVFPADSASDVALAASVTVLFSEPVSLDPGWFTLTCSRSGSHAGLTEGDVSRTSYGIQPESGFYLNEVCSMVIHQEFVHDLDTNDPPDLMDADYAWSFRTLAPSYYVYLSLIFAAP